MSVLFIDDDSELNYKTADSLGLNLIKMPYTICGEEHYYDLGRNYDAKKFFDTVRAGNMPITSGLNVETYKEYFEPYFKQGEDILYVSFSSQMSSTFTYMDIAVKELSEQYPAAKFRRFDTKGISMATGLCCYYAGVMHKEGKSNDEIIEFLDKFALRVNAVFSPNNLFHLKRGGRISAVAATAGTILQLKPIIRLNDEGKLVNTAKVQGRNKSVNYIAEDVIKHAEETDKYPIVILNADCPEDSQKIENKLRAAFPEADIWLYDVGPVIGTHCGPDTIACIYVGKERYLN